MSSVLIYCGESPVNPQEFDAVITLSRISERKLRKGHTRVLSLFDLPYIPEMATDGLAVENALHQLDKIPHFRWANLAWRRAVSGIGFYRQYCAPLK